VEKLKTHAIDTSVLGKADFEHHRVLLVTAHRRENWGDSMSEIGARFCVASPT